MPEVLEELLLLMQIMSGLLMTLSVFNYRSLSSCQLTVADPGSEERGGGGAPGIFEDFLKYLDPPLADSLIAISFPPVSS